MKVPIFRIIFIIILSVKLGSAQEHTHRFFSVYDGLPQSQLLDITQDSTGFIWVATKDGVARFDGFKFDVFTIENGLVSNFVYKIMPTDSCIWFFSSDGFTKFKNGKWTPYLFNKRRIRYAGVYNGKMIFLEEGKKNWQFENDSLGEVKFDFNLDKQLLYFNIVKNNIDSSYIVYDIDKGIFIFKNNNSSFIDPPVSNFHLLPDSNKLLYYSYSESKNILLDLKTMKKSFWGKYLTGEYFSGHTIYKNGIIHFISNEKVGFHINNELEFINKKFNLAVCSLIDNNGNFWVGDEDGLYFFNKFEFIEFTINNSQILPYVWDIKEFPEKTYYFASHTNGLQKYKNGIFSLQRTIKNSYGKVINTFYFNTPPANKKQMILNHSEGILKFDGKNFSPFIKEIGSRFAALVTFYDSIQNQYLVATSSEKLFVGDGVHSLKIYNACDSTFQKNILAISYDLDNDICIGVKGIKKFKNGKFLNYPNIPDTVQFRVFSLQKDHKGNLWIGTDRGLWFYNYDTISQISTKYFKNYVTFLQMVDTTWIMGGTTLGLPLLYLPDFYKNGTQKVKYYDRYNGFTGRDCGQNGTLHDSKNTFWIPTVDRVLRFDPTKIEFNTKPPIIHLKGISLLGENLSWTFIGDTIHQLNFDQNGLKFSYVGLNYSAPERVRYKYRLLGFGNIWSEETASREAIFTNLKPGKYTFELLACNEDDYWTEHPTQFSFVIIPAWYQRLTVKAGLILLFLIILTLITIRITKRRASKQKKELELKIALQKGELEKKEYQKLYQDSQIHAIREKIKGQDEERTRIARELHDGIGGNLVGLKLMMEQAIDKPNPEDISGLVTIVSNTLEEVRTISHNLMPPEFSGISLNQILQLHIDKLNIAAKINFSIQFIPQTGWEQIPENIQVEIYRIIQELCSNIIKYSNASVVDLQLSMFENDIHLIMEDNGSPFDYNQNGIGYRNINERLRMLNGRFEKNTGAEKGNTYHIQIPLISDGK
ncbi:MAG: triple tyrosine motif-containing protein [Bacteroidales bacterium]